MHIDILGNLIGAGEDTTIKILQHLTKLPILKYPRDYPSSGIYRQFPLVKLLDYSKIDFKLESWHEKHKVDIVIFTENRKIAVRVQGDNHSSGRGHQHETKQQRDTVQAWLLKISKVDIVDVIKRDNPQIFKERYNEQSIQEIKDSFKTFQINLKGVNNASNSS